MAAAGYTSGTWLGVIRSRTAVLLGPGSSPELAQSLWDLLGTTPEVHEVLHAVTSGFGVSLAQIPSFGIVDFRDSLRVFLRGDLDLIVQLPDASVELNGRDVTTWTERRLAAPEGYVLTVAGDSRPGTLLPLGEGVVLLRSLAMALAANGDAAYGDAANETAVPDAVAAQPEAGPQRAVEPVPEVDKLPEFEPAPEPELTRAEAPAAAPVPDAAPEVEPDVVEESEAGPAAGPSSSGTGTGAMSGDSEVSAETVMGLMDEDSRYAENPEPVLPEAPVSFPDQVPAHELTGSYDHLWEKTVVRRIEDAAVRDEPEAEDPGHPENQAPNQASNQAPNQAHLNQAPDDDAAPAAAASTGLSGGLIDSVPWRTGAGSAPAVQVPPSFNLPAAPGAPAPLAADPGVSAPAKPAPVSGAAVSPADFDPDHDGQTIMKSDLNVKHGPAGTAAQPDNAPEPRTAVGPLVLARVCERGHANPPTHAQCAVCRSPLPADAVQVARPRLGRMRVSTGEMVDLDQSLVIGRQPSVSRVQGGGMPRLVQVASPSGDISRSHVEVRLEGWHVMLCDLKATNGTVLVREGQQPRRLAQNEMAILLDGDIAELGDDISLRFEEIL